MAAATLVVAAIALALYESRPDEEQVLATDPATERLESLYDFFGGAASADGPQALGSARWADYRVVGFRHEPQAGKTESVYTGMLTIDRGEELSVITALTACDAHAEGLAMAFEVPGGSLVVALDADAGSSIHFGNVIPVTGSAPFQAWSVGDLSADVPVRHVNQEEPGTFCSMEQPP